MKVVRFNTSFYEVGAHGSSEEKFAAGKCYPVTSETERHVAHGIAEVIEAPDDVDKALAAAEAARTKADKAADVADAAAANASAAQDAAAIVSADAVAADAAAGTSTVAGDAAAA